MKLRAFLKLLEKLSTNVTRSRDLSHHSLYTSSLWLNFSDAMYAGFHTHEELPNVDLDAAIWHMLRAAEQQEFVNYIDYLQHHLPNDNVHWRRVYNAWNAWDKGDDVPLEPEADYEQEISAAVGRQVEKDNEFWDAFAAEQAQHKEK